MSELKAGRRLAKEKLDQARQALEALGELVKWAGYEDDETTGLAYITGEKSVKSCAVKLLSETSDTLTVGGYGIVYGGIDLEGETFTAETNYHLDLVPTKPILYDHGMNAKIAATYLGKSVKVDDDGDGLWVEAELDRHGEYMEQVRKLIDAGVLGWSSGSVGHLVRKDNGIIKSWPIVEFSLTPTPAEPRTLGVDVLKSLAEVDATYSAFLSETPAGVVGDADGAETDAIKSVEPEEANTMGDENTPTIDVAAIAQEAATKAVAAFVAQQTPTNAIPVATASAPAVIKSLGDDPVKAVAHYIRTGDNGGLRGYGDPAVKAYNNTDMNIGTAADGGDAVPTGMVQEILAKRDEAMLATRLGVRNVPGKGLTVNYPIDNEADVLFTSEAEAGSLDQDAPAITKKAFTLVKYAKYITLSWELLRDEDANLMAFVNDWIARGWAATHNSLLITEALANGTAGLTLDAAAAIGATEIPELVGKVLPEYQDGAAWILHPTTFSYITGLASSSVFTFAPQPGGSPAQQTLWGYRVYQSSHATAYAASAKSLIFGNFGFMGKREGTGLTILRDPYSAAATGQVKLWVWFDAVYGVLQAEAIQYATHPSA